AHRLSFAFSALFLAACGQPSADGPGAAVGGKADCPAGQSCVATSSYDVVFTDPVCASYEYQQPVANARNTDELSAKPKNVFCTKDDSEPSGSRPFSPQSRLKAIIDDTQAGDELFLSFLSFSDQVIADALCDAAERGVDVDFVLDKENARSEALAACGADIMIRGHQGSVGFQHTKLVMVNPHGGSGAPLFGDEAILALVNDLSVDFEELDVDAGLNATAAANIIAHRDGPDGTPGTSDDDLFDDIDELDAVSHVGPAALEDLGNYAEGKVGSASSAVTMVFGSGNLSSGTHLHHENWHFAEVARDSYFVQNHVCLVDALTDPTKESTDGKGNFRTALQDCRAQITATQADDLQAFFIPALEDRNRIRAIMQTEMLQAGSVDIAAHRFSWRQMLDAIDFQLQDDPDFEARLVADDDTYWLQPLVGAPLVVGFNTENEAEEISNLIVSGGGATGDFDDDSRFQVRFMETNHSARLLHHNKFMIFRDDAGEATGVIYGAANFTGTGFDSNLENVYFTTRPEIVAAFDRQFKRFWGETPATGADPAPPRATAPAEMPIENVLPIPPVP
ncbi:MAG: hypothetical protein KJO07_22615, partial [Deltaproteobacteria bacterium]|nr:hypothetical protein [Deltaproteobacteria bacterium]